MYLYESPCFLPSALGSLRAIGMLACVRAQYRRASLYFSAVAAFRSNGILLALYVPWSSLIDPLLLSSTVPHTRALPASMPCSRSCHRTLTSSPHLPHLLPHRPWGPDSCLQVRVKRSHSTVVLLYVDFTQDITMCLFVVVFAIP
jgi:hypothetical protein